MVAGIYQQVQQVPIPPLYVRPVVEGCCPATKTKEELLTHGDLIECLTLTIPLYYLTHSQSKYHCLKHPLTVFRYLKMADIRFINRLNKRLPKIIKKELW